MSVEIFTTRPYKLYFHINPMTCKIFYVGIGKNNRELSKRARNPHWHNIVNKYGYVVDIIFENLSWEEACILEKKYIRHFGRRDLGLGCLVNMTEGGDGNVGSVRSQESIEKCLATRKGYKHSKSTIAKMSGENHPGYNRERSEETKLKLSLFNKGKKKGPMSEEHKLKIKYALQGRTKSIEHIQKIKEAKIKQCQ